MIMREHRELPTYWPDLPDKPSELLRLAVDDARALDRTKYIPEYSTWHVYFFMELQGRELESHCQVCFAGAVMAGTLKVPRKTTMRLEYFPESTQTKLDALDFFRQGDPFHALATLGCLPKEEDIRMQLDKDLPQVNHNHFYDWVSFDKFLEQIEGMIVALQKNGL